MNKLNKTQKTKVDSFQYKSTKIRYLLSLGYKVKEVKNLLPGTLYQHVRNVKEMPVKNPLEKF